VNAPPEVMVALFAIWFVLSFVRRERGQHLLASAIDLESLARHLYFRASKAVASVDVSGVWKPIRRS